MKCFIVIIASLVSLTLAAQENFEKNYTPLMSKGELPSIMFKSSKEKYEEKVEELLTQEQLKDTKKAKDKFYLTSTFGVDALIKNGNVLFGNEVVQYLNQLKDYILKENGLNHELSNVHVYLIKSSAVNAFATDEGAIFFTSGLIARIENEGQLAFIMAHELVHYLEKHAVSAFVYGEKLLNSRGRINSDFIIKSMSSYSKKHEFEADMKGFELYSKLKYPLEESEKALRLLSIAHVPGYENEFNAEYLQSDSFQIPNEYLILGYRIIMPKLDNHEDNSTHPELNDRIFEIKKQIEKEKSIKVKLELQDPFLRFKRICQFETIESHLSNGNYLLGLFESHSLLLEYSENVFLKRALLHSIYGLAKIKVNEGEIVPIDLENELEGPISTVNTFFRERSTIEVLCIALRFSLEMKLAFSENQEYDHIARSIVYDLVNEDEDIFEILNSKDENLDWHLKALKEFLPNKSIEVLFNGVEAIKQTEEYPNRVTRRVKRIPTNFQIDKTNEPIESIVVFSPLAYELGKGNMPDLLKSEEKQKRLNDVISETAELNDLKINTYSRLVLEKNDVDFLNDMAQIGDYIYEILSSIDKEKVHYNKLSPGLSQRMGSKKILFTISTEYRKQSFTSLSFLKLFGFHYALPDVLGKIVFPERRVTFESFLFDAEEMKLLFFESSRYKCRHSEGQLKSKYYNLFYKIKN